MAKKTTPNTSDLLKWIERGTAKEDNRPVLTAAYVSDGITASADGYRLHVVYQALGEPNKHGFIAFKKTYPDVMSDTPHKFPDFMAIIPDKNAVKFVVEVDREQFTQAVKLALVMAKDSNNSVKLSFRPDVDALHIVGRSAERGDTETALSARFVENRSDLYAAQAIAVNGRYLIDAAEGFFGETITLRFHGSNNPMVIGVLDEQIAVMMPMATGDKSWAQSSTVNPVFDATLEPMPIGYRAPKTKTPKKAKQPEPVYADPADVKDLYAELDIHEHLGSEVVRLSITLPINTCGSAADLQTIATADVETAKAYRRDGEALGFVYRHYTHDAVYVYASYEWKRELFCYRMSNGFVVRELVKGTNDLERRAGQRNQRVIAGKYDAPNVKRIRQLVDFVNGIIAAINPPKPTSPEEGNSAALYAPLLPNDVEQISEAVTSTASAAPIDDAPMHTFRELQIVRGRVVEQTRLYVIVHKGYDADNFISYTDLMPIHEGENARFQPSDGERLMHEYQGGHFLSGHTQTRDGYNGMPMTIEPAYDATLEQKVAAVDIYRRWWAMDDSLLIKRPDVRTHSNPNPVEQITQPTRPPSSILERSEQITTRPAAQCVGLRHDKARRYFLNGHQLETIYHDPVCQLDNKIAYKLCACFVERLPKTHIDADTPITVELTTPF